LGKVLGGAPAHHVRCTSPYSAQTEQGFCFLFSNAAFVSYFSQRSAKYASFGDAARLPQSKKIELSAVVTGGSDTSQPLNRKQIAPSVIQA
jgi:hypothetical protein